MRQHALSLPEHCTRAGAEALAQRLDAYWHARGHTHVRHWVVPLAWADRTLHRARQEGIHAAAACAAAEAKR